MGPAGVSACWLHSGLRTSGSTLKQDCDPTGLSKSLRQRKSPLGNQVSGTSKIKQPSRALGNYLWVQLRNRTEHSCTSQRIIHRGISNISQRGKLSHGFCKETSYLINLLEFFERAKRDSRYNLLGLSKGLWHSPSQGATKEIKSWVRGKILPWFRNWLGDSGNKWLVFIMAIRT